MPVEPFDFSRKVFKNAERFCLSCVFLGVVIWSPSFAQQNYDPNFMPRILQPAFSHGKGPTVLIDSGHHNFHTSNGRFRPFAELLKRDGYTVKSHPGCFNQRTLKQANILVISNALHKDNVSSWRKPTPSAFTKDEIELLNQWIANGGALLLIADHMPFPGASESLAATFGFHLNNGFAFNSHDESTIRFNRDDGTLAHHPITEGRKKIESIRGVLTFTGHAFRVPSRASSLLRFGGNAYSLTPKTAWQFAADAPRVEISGWSQGATLIYGEGRVAVFGEAAAFTAQIAGNSKTKIGMNSPNAPDNRQFVLNVIHWLSGLLEDKS